MFKINTNAIASIFWNPVQEVQHQDMTRFNQNSFFENQLACSQTKFSLLFHHEGWQSGKTYNIKSKKPNKTKLLPENQ